MNVTEKNGHKDRTLNFGQVLSDRVKQWVAEYFLSRYTARPSFKYYRQVYFVYSGLQDESLQVTISKLPYGS